MKCNAFDCLYASSTQWVACVPVGFNYSHLRQEGPRSDWSEGMSGGGVLSRLLIPMGGSCPLRVVPFIPWAGGPGLYKLAERESISQPVQFLHGFYFKFSPVCSRQATVTYTMK